jgi:LuxR family maltose regulon positive regulatory protein
VAEALAMLEQLRQVAETTHNIMRLIEILALQALAASARGRADQALAILERAARLAAPGRFIRTFVDLGPRLAGLLHQLAARGVETEYLGQVLAAFAVTVAGPAQHDRRAAQAALVEPLTERELDVLALLAARRSNKEIAQALTISPLTVRTHTTHIFQKLGVNSRRQAVARARALGLLPPDADSALSLS